MDGQKEDQMQAMRPAGYGWICTTIAEEAFQDTTIITSILLIHSVPTIVLFDSSSTHTFLARVFIDRICVSVKDLVYDLAVSTTTSATLPTGECVRGVPIIIQQCMLLTDFVVLLMSEFNVIFIIDWMMRHRALIDCQKKKVKLCLPHHKRITFKGRDKGSGGRLITIQRGQHLVERGCKAFLACIVPTRKKPTPIASKLLIGGDATHTIPKEATELPMARLTELNFEVLPCNALAAKKPYQVPPFQFQELKSQLREM